jgi:hypothetical protein
MVKITLSENYSVELEVAQTNCFGRIFHPSILHYTNKIGYFIASIVEENETFVKAIMVDLSLRKCLKSHELANLRTINRIMAM